MDWESFFKRIGINTTSWRWRFMRWEQHLQIWRESRRERKERPPSRFKFCNACGAMLERDDKRCTRCGIKVQSWRAYKVRRALGVMVPSWAPVTSALMLANLVNLVIAMLSYGGSTIWKPETDMLLGMGALVPRLALQGQWWRVITYGYLHIGFIHIAFNMFALSQIGPMLEEQIGRVRFFVLYSLALIGGAAADLLLRGQSMTVIAGASGALFGLIGFGVVHGHLSGDRNGIIQRNFFAKWALYGFLFGFLVGADNIAHAGGFIAGGLVGLLVHREGARGIRRHLPAWIAAAWLLIAATAGSFIWLIVDKLR